MEQRITRAKARVAAAEVPFETPGPVERSERLSREQEWLRFTFPRQQKDRFLSIADFFRPVDGGAGRGLL